MKRTIIIAIAVALAAAIAPAQRRPPMPDTAVPQEEELASPKDREKAILATLAGLAEHKQIPANLTEADGRLLRVLVEATNSKKVVEIGTYEAALSLWLCMALDKTGGKLNAIQLNPQNSGAARSHYKHAGVEDLVNFADGDAQQALAKLKGPIDLALVSAPKAAHAEYVNRVAPLVRRGGLILIHYTDQVMDGVPAAKDNPEFETVLYRPGGAMAVALKKR